ncbi:hypothetical protein HMPREF0731_4714, partial [Pseudoroseomonas cervicalis ATCC 49957]
GRVRAGHGGGVPPGLGLAVEDAQRVGLDRQRVVAAIAGAGVPHLPEAVLALDGAEPGVAEVAQRGAEAGSRLRLRDLQGRGGGAQQQQGEGDTGDHRRAQRAAAPRVEGRGDGPATTAPPRRQ